MTALIPLNAKSGLIIVAIVGVLECMGIVAIYTTMVAPRRAEIASIRTQCSAKEPELLTAAKAGTPAVRDAVEQQYAEAMAALSHWLIAPDARVKVEVRSMATEAGAVNLAFSDQGKTIDVKAGAIEEEWIDVTFKATFNQLAMFINALERHEPAIFVDRLAVTYSAGGEGQHDVTMTLAGQRLVDTKLGSALRAKVAPDDELAEGGAD